MFAKNLRADRVERAKPAQALARLAQHVQRPLAHFPGGLVGEGHGQRLRRPGQPRADDVCETRGQHARFARAGTGKHQQRAFGRQHGLALLRVQAVQILRLALGSGRFGGGHLGNGQAIRIRTHSEHIAPNAPLGRVCGTHEYCEYASAMSCSQKLNLEPLRMKKPVFLIAAAIVSSLLPAQADAPSNPTACNPVVGDGTAKATMWLEERVAALQELENPTEQDADLLKEFQASLLGIKDRQMSGQDNDEARCTPAKSFDNSDKTT